MNAPIKEEILDPGLEIVDAHHHLWFVPDAVIRSMESIDTISARALTRVFRKSPRYLFEELLADFREGHNIRASVFIDSHAMYRADGPELKKSIGEIEFVNGVAAMADSGVFGDVRCCAGIVGGIDLTLGDAIEEVLGCHIHAGGGRYRGVRGSFTAYDDDEGILGPRGSKHKLLDKEFRQGFKWLQPLGLSFDAFILEPQLPDLIDLARSFPDTPIILNHLGSPVGVGRYTECREERFACWRKNMYSLSECENVAVKLGGFGNPFAGFPSFMASPPASSAQLANEWRPYVETCIELFGVHRCMFESNFPVDSATCSYSTLWNAFKRIAAGASQDERIALFGGTAMRVYRLPVELIRHGAHR
jgi:predicted TIM-barrel fold metal-dependent hydrolase